MNGCAQKSRAQRNLKLFDLEPEEECVELCGEIYRTRIGSIVFHCTLCDERYDGFSQYEHHLGKEHFSAQYTYDNAVNPSIERNEADEFIETFEIVERENSENDLSPENVQFDELFEHEEEFIFDRSSVSGQVEIEICMIGNETRTQLPKPVSLRSEKQTIIVNKSRDEVPKSLELKSGLKKISTYHEKSKTKILEIPKDIREVKKVNIVDTTPAEQRKHKCPICSLAFKDKHNMHQHFDRHSKERKVECQECDKRFYTNSDLKIHMVSHSGERPFLCSDCGQSFTRQHVLNLHIKRHRGQRDFECPECHKRFFRKEVLKNHMNVHTKARKRKMDAELDVHKRHLGHKNRY